MPEFSIRAACPADCADLAILENMASYGLALWFWQEAVRMGKAEDAYEWGRRHLRVATTPTGWRNAYVAEKDGTVSGAAAAYEMQVDGTLHDIPQLAPLIELQKLVSNSWYLDTLAVYPESRKLGVGDALIDHAKELGRGRDHQTMTLIAEDSNLGALRLYSKHGFSEQARRAYVKFNDHSKTKNWLLLSAPLQ